MTKAISASTRGSPDYTDADMFCDSWMLSPMLRRVSI